MQLISKFNNGNRFLLRVIDIFSTYEWFIPLKDEKSTTITNAFQKILDKSNHKPNKTWVDKGSEFYNRSMKSFLRNNNIDMYSMHNEGKSIVAERFIRTLKYKIYKHMTLILKNVYIDRLDDIVNKYNNTHIYINFNSKNNTEDPKFKVGDNVRISQYKNIFAKSYVTNWSEEIFVFTKAKNTVPWTYLISDPNGEAVVGTFYEKKTPKKQIKKSLELKK